jgi:hypothetical protein
LLVTVLGFVLQGDPDLQARLVNSTLAELPIIGSQLRENVHSLKGKYDRLAADLATSLATSGSSIWSITSRSVLVLDAGARSGRI